MAKRTVTITLEVDPTEYHEVEDTTAGTIYLVAEMLLGDADFPEEGAVITVDGMSRPFLETVQMLQTKTIQDHRVGQCPPDCDHKLNKDCALSCYSDELPTEEIPKGYIDDHNHGNEMFKPDTCSACKALQDSEDPHLTAHTPVEE